MGLPDRPTVQDCRQEANQVLLRSGWVREALIKAISTDPATIPALVKAHRLTCRDLLTRIC